VVLLAFSDGHNEFIDDAHVHGFRDDQLLIATGVPGAGADRRAGEDGPRRRSVARRDLCARRRTGRRRERGLTRDHRTGGLARRPERRGRWPRTRSLVPPGG